MIFWLLAFAVLGAFMGHFMWPREEKLHSHVHTFDKWNIINIRRVNAKGDCLAQGRKCNICGYQEIEDLNVTELGMAKNWPHAYDPNAPKKEENAPKD